MFNASLFIEVLQTARSPEGKAVGVHQKFGVMKVPMRRLTPDEAVKLDKWLHTCFERAGQWIDTVQIIDVLREERKPKETPEQFHARARKFIASIVLGARKDVAA